MKKLFTPFLLIISNALFAQTIFFHEDMENPDSVVSYGIIGFSQDSNFYSQGNYSMLGTYGINDSSYLTTISFSTLGDSTIVLQFDQIAKVSYFDACTIEYSDDSINWTQITTTNSVY